MFSQSLISASVTTEQLGMGTYKIENNFDRVGIYIPILYASLRLYVIKILHFVPFVNDIPYCKNKCPTSWYNY